MKSRKLLIGAGVLGILLLVGIVGRKPVLVWWKVRAANRALFDWRNADALELLNAARELDEDHAEVQLLLARGLRRTGDISGAEVHLRKARDFGAGQARVEREQWLIWAQRGDLQQAEPHLPALLRDPGENGRDVCRAFVEGYLTQYRLIAARRLIDAWEKVYRDDPLAAEYRGIVCDRLNQTDAAIAAYRRALELGADSARVHVGLAEQLSKLSRFAEADVHFSRCLELEPDNLQALAGRTTCLLAASKVDQARLLSLQAIERHPDSHIAMWCLGRVELAYGAAARGIALLQKAVAVEPGDWEIRFALAAALSEAGRTAESQAERTAGQKLRQQADRVANLLEEIRAQPGEARLRYELGKTLIEIGRAEAGVGWLNSVLQIDPGHGPTHRELARWYRRSGQAGLAERHDQYFRPGPRAGRRF